MKRRLVSLAAGAALIVSIVGFSQPTAAAGGRPHGGHHDWGVGTVEWAPCDNPTLVDFGAECGMLSVPLDYSRPWGDKIQLALSRVRHTVPDDEYQGIMLVNPGGPGGSGLIFSIFGNFVPNGVGFAYDWIGFDPRGVGSSVPSLSCIPDYSAGPRPQYEPVTRDIERAWLERSSDYARACGHNGRKLLDHLKTIDNVRDLNAIRSALGERQINYYGFSYGTYLGQVFATVYPSKVRKMVFDANVDPRRVWYEANLDQDYAFEDVIQLFFDWVARHDDAYHLGTTADEVEAKYYTAHAALAANPQGILGSAELADGFLLAGYLQFFWPDVATALASLVNDGDPGPATDLFLTAVDVENDNGYAIYLATECTDARWPQRWRTWRRDNTRVAQDAPFFTWGNAWFNAPCKFWPARSGHPVEVKGKHVPPILLLGETIDGATPITGSLEVRRRFRNSVLIATEGTTHANSLAGYPCVDDPIAAYLLDGTLPPRVEGNGPDVLCPAVPEPEPAPPEAGVAASRVAVTTVDTRRLLQEAIIGR